MRGIAIAAGLASIAFHLGLIFSGLIPNLVSRPLHMLLAVPWVMFVPAASRPARVIGFGLGGAGMAAAAWVAWNEGRLADQYGYLEGPEQLGIAIVLLLCVLEMARRAIGWPLPLVAAIALAYGLLGQWIPGEFGHAGQPLAGFLGTLTIAEGGLWGSLTGVSVNIVAVFVILGAVLNAGAAGEGFMNLATVAAGHLRGGAAKVSVLASALFGSISGSASANVASTGAVTLPAMTRLGYAPRLAGAVEAVASSGGQIMPPLMGAGAFVMVELTGVPYNDIMAAALLPALLYFLTVWIGIDAYARRDGLRGLAAHERPAWARVWRSALFFAVPFGVLLFGMFVAEVTPTYAASLAILAAAVLLSIDVHLRMVPREIARRVAGAALAAGRQIAMIASIILCASIIVGVLGITGLGVKITSVILALSQGALAPALALTALACLVLGMEVPTTAAYVICVSVAGPALVELGLEPLQAHLFVFWYALLSTITPPVCGAVFIAAGMIGENWLRIAATAMTLGVGLYLIPPAMIAHPALIAVTGQPAAAMLAAVRIAIGLGLISHGLISRRSPWLRLALAGTGLATLFV
ncbi:MAG: TRAP transporter fused permease subunit [Burkholderiaceae bacterium]